MTPSQIPRIVSNCVSYGVVGRCWCLKHRLDREARLVLGDVDGRR
jgi:hypothetical protein